MEPLDLHDDRYFDPDPTVRRIARDLYESVRDLPLVCPHGHVDPRLLADDAAFPEPTSLILTPDHYIFRMLYSQGIRLEDLGIPTRDGSPVEANPRLIWQRFADHYYLFAGTPTRGWLDYVFYHVFGLRERLTTESAMRVYDALSERLQDPAFRPRALFERFKIEVLATTDAASDPLPYHQQIRASGWKGHVVPTFRPDTAFQIASATWLNEKRRLEELAGQSIGSYADFICVLEDRRAYFRSLGATATDHGVESPYTHELSAGEAEKLFQRALIGEATANDEAQFLAHMLMVMARMSIEDGMVMQLHPGSYRNHNRSVFDRFGPDKGGDIPLAAEFTRNLAALLNRYGTDPRLTLILFTLDESTYTRELAPLAGHYPALRLGPAWWFFDSYEGMLRYRQAVTETAGFYNTAGFNDDTRAFLSIPARHDLSRRVDATYVAGLVARHILSPSDARQIVYELAYNLARTTYRFDKRVVLV